MGTTRDFPRTEEARTTATAREWTGLAVLMLPCLLVALDSHVLNLAIPSIAAELRPSGTQQLWIVDSYVFFVAGSLIAMGALGDRIGRRRLLLAGSAAFALASVLAAYAPDAGTLIAARILTGVAGAALMPATLSLIRVMFTDRRQRTLAIGVWTASFALGGILGPLAGGALLGHFWWGSVFLIAVPAVAVLLLTGPFVLPEFRDRGPAGFDGLGAGLSLTAVLTFVYGLKRLAEGGADPVAVLAMTAGLGLAVVFVRRQRTHPAPLLDLALFRRPAFTAALIANSLAFFVLYNSELALAQYLQLVAGLTPLSAGLWTLPSVLAYLAGSALAPLLVRAWRRAAVVSAALAVIAAGFAVQAAAGGLGAIIAGTVIVSIGLAPVYALTTELIVASVPPHRAGAASAIGETGAELGGALGIAVLGSLGVFVYRTVLGRGGTLGDAVATAAGLPPGPREQLLRAARHAYELAFAGMAATSAALMIVVAAGGLVLLRSARDPLGGGDDR